MTTLDKPCIEKRTNLSGSGYPQVERKGKRMAASRAVFLDTHGFLPAVVRHRCDNPLCIEPTHLQAGTHADNARDRVERGRNGSPGRPQLNKGMPNRREDFAAYQRERKRRIEAGTWVTSYPQERTSHPQERKRRIEACPEGHPYDEANSYYAPGARWPHCRICRRNRNVAAQDRRPRKPRRNEGMPPAGTTAYRREYKRRVKRGEWVFTRGTVEEDIERHRRQREYERAREERLEARREEAWAKDRLSRLRRHEMERYPRNDPRRRAAEKAEREATAEQRQRAAEAIAAQLSEAEPRTLKQRRLLEAHRAMMG